MKRNRYDFTKFEIRQRYILVFHAENKKKTIPCYLTVPVFFLVSVLDIKIVHCGGNQWGLIMADFVWDKVTHYHVTIGDLIVVIDGCNQIRL